LHIFKLKYTWPYALAALVFLATQVLAAHRALAERFYARGMYPRITAVLSRVSARVPFSITEIAAYALIAAALLSLALVVWRRWRFRRWLYGVTAGLALLFAWFYLAWGFNYFREPLAQSLRLPKSPADSLEFRDTLQELIAAANRAYLPLNSLEKRSIDHHIERSYAQWTQPLPLAVPPGNRRPKTLLLNFWLNKTLTSGFFSPIFHEVHLNADLLPFEYPFALAHEKAHQMGYANEAEANFLAFLVCAGSDDARLRYSGLSLVLGSFLGQARRRLRDYRRVAKSVRPEIWADFRKSSERWQKYAGRMSQFSMKAYDRYLKANKIAEGMANYSGVVAYVLAWRRMHGLPDVSTSQ